MASQSSKFIESRRAAIVMMLLYAFLMAIATLVEKYYSTAIAKAAIYYSPLFLLLQLMMVVNFVGVTVKYHLFSRQRWGYLLVHGAFIVILCGAAVTHFWSREGMMSIREGEVTSEMVVGNARDWHVERLPFEVELRDFRLLRYPGSKSPSSYESDLVVHDGGEAFEAQVYMNHVLDYKGYRFFQSSYDEDELGTILSVSYDTAGRTITYIGYVLLLVGLLGCLIGRKSRLRGLLRQLDKAAIVCVVCATSFAVSAAAKNVPESQVVSDPVSQVVSAPVSQVVSAPRSRGVNIPAEHAERFGHLAMQSPQGRIVPVNTFAWEVVHKLQVEELPGGMNPNQFLLSLLANPVAWADVPLVLVDDPGLRKSMGKGRDYISYMDAFDANGDYRYRLLVESAYHRRPEHRTLSDKELLKVDERFNILHLLFNRELVNVLPGVDGHGAWGACGDLWSNYLGAVLVASTADVGVGVSSGVDGFSGSGVSSGVAGQSLSGLASIEGESELWKMADAALQRIEDYQLEVFPELTEMRPHLDMEVKYNSLDLLRYSRLIYLIGGGILLVLAILGWFSKKCNKGLGIARVVCLSVVIVGTLLHAVNMGMRWYISGHVPLSNSYETMVLLAWTTVLAGMFFYRKSSLVTALSTLLGGVILFVSSLNWMDPQITPLVPVLKSPWLMSHVTCMMVSYGLLGLGAVLGVINLILCSVEAGRSGSVGGCFVEDGRSGSVVDGRSKGMLSQQVGRLTIINEVALTLGLFFMLVGIFLGAVWANESWGTYWSWDPKETWALITAVLYAALLHWRWFAKRNDLIFNLLSQWAILAVLMTYFGVNYLLSGMHSYGDTTLFSDFPLWIFIVASVVFILPGVIALVTNSKKEAKA